MSRQPVKRVASILGVIGIAIAPLVIVGLVAFRRISSPLRSLLLLAGWELVAAIAAFGGKLWKRFEERLLDATFHWIDTHTGGFLFYQTRYERKVHHRYRSMDTRAFRTIGEFDVELADVFVDLKIIPQAPHQAQRTPIVQDIVYINTERKSIWEFLSSPIGSHNFVILGRPGSGKSTLLK